MAQVRPLQPQDIEAVLAIERDNTGNEARRLFLKETAEFHLKSKGQDMVALVLEEQGKVRGFVLGRISGPEFGAREPLGWISVVGVDKAARGKGLGSQLGNALLAEFRRRGVGRVRTLVDATDEALLNYFRSLGLLESRVEVMEKNL
ncbi:MAG TPA: GNAT family N-acetyltransferase [Candidatus Thermoplasmatota archaeon]|jgi:ribosomal protein S18 acetylase RimI-like enzyme|nr:GNAT family N-acetyltransferase [Candidatus Thermoplasmatota archaeon]